MDLRKENHGRTMINSSRNSVSILTLVEGSQDLNDWLTVLAAAAASH